VTSFYTPEVSLTHLPIRLEECPRMGSAVLLFFIGILDVVASGISGVNVVH